MLLGSPLPPSLIEKPEKESKFSSSTSSQSIRRNSTSSGQNSPSSLQGTNFFNTINSPSSFTFSDSSYLGNSELTSNDDQTITPVQNSGQNAGANSQNVSSNKTEREKKREMDIVWQTVFTIGNHPQSLTALISKFTFAKAMEILLKRPKDYEGEKVIELTILVAEKALLSGQEKYFTQIKPATGALACVIKKQQNYHTSLGESCRKLISVLPKLEAGGITEWVQYLRNNLK